MQWQTAGGEWKKVDAIGWTLYDVVLCGGWRWDGMACRLDVVFSEKGRGGGRKDGDALVLFCLLLWVAASGIQVYCPSETVSWSMSAIGSWSFFVSVQSLAEPDGTRFSLPPKPSHEGPSQPSRSSPTTPERSVPTSFIYWHQPFIIFGHCGWNVLFSFHRLWSLGRILKKRVLRNSQIEMDKEGRQI